MEADTAFSVRQTGALLYLFQPYLESRGIHAADDLLMAMKTNNHFSRRKLAPHIQDAFESLNKFTRFEKFREREELMLKDAHKIDRIPILVNGLSLVDDYRFKKEGIDPYSVNHIFTNILLDRLPEHVSENCLDNFALLYVQPMTYVQIPLHGRLEDMLLHTVDDRFGSHSKSGEHSHPNSSYNPRLLRTDRYRSVEVYCNRQLMAMKYAILLDEALPPVMPRFRERGIKEVPLYMEKGADATAVMQAVNNYTKKPIPFSHIGQGIMTGTQKSPYGICDPAAVGRLFGFMINACREERSSMHSRPKPGPLEFEPGRHRFDLIEKECVGRHPNLEDLIDRLREQDEEGYSAAKNFADLYGLGFKRIEPRLVELFSSHTPVYDDFRALSKKTYRWQDLLKSRRILTPDQVPGFFEMPVIYQGQGDFRGSEFSLSSNPHFDTRWLTAYHQGELDVGCSIEKVLSAMPREQFLTILKENAPEDSLIWAHYDPETMTPIPAIRGSFIHAISSDPLEGLAHYQTLKAAGITPTPSDHYTETPFYQEHDGISLSYHPDCYLFLQRSDSTYDLLILDTKTNRVTPYPEHKYLLQTFFYGWAIKQSVETHLDTRVHDIYSVLNKCAFYRGFNGEKPDHTLSHRPQKYAPITRFDSSHFFHRAMPDMIRIITEEKDRLRTEKDYFQHYKRHCSCTCFESNRIVCDYLATSDPRALL
ncbi:MAG: hypothetical protein ACQESG_00570 [Nanobdellota archaeon]